MTDEPLVMVDHETMVISNTSISFILRPYIPGQVVVV